MQIDMTFQEWGPLLVETPLQKHIVDDLLKFANRLDEQNDFSNNLAGQIKREYRYKEEQEKYFNELLIPYLDSYLKVLHSNYHRLDNQHFNTRAIDIILKELWVNFQTKGEYNPPHMHAGDISFVIYCAIPDNMYNEKTYGRTIPPGYIDFIFGSKSSSPSFDATEFGSDHFKKLLQPITHHAMRPVVGNMLIFPSYLEHTVSAFNSDGERISVSGNVLITREMRNE